jgi:iron complex transport system ATP-binding protein
VLELSGVGFHFRRRDWILRNVSLAAPQGTVTAVLGRNGTGKTTLIRCAAGLLDPQEGAVVREGAVGFVPQAHGGAFAYSALDMVVMGRARHIRLFATPGRDDRRAALRAMDRVGVMHLKSRSFPTLSGGEQQLVLIARAVASECPILALDEPSSGLDLRNQAEVLVLLRSLADTGLTVLLTTHHPDHAMYVADFAVLMMGVGDVRTGPASALLTDDALSALYDVDVHTVTYPARGADHRAIISRYDADDYVLDHNGCMSASSMAGWAEGEPERSSLMNPRHEHPKEPPARHPEETRPVESAFGREQVTDADAEDKPNDMLAGQREDKPEQ